jgi:hypothetical protein
MIGCITVLFVLSSAIAVQETGFLDWYGDYARGWTPKKSGFHSGKSKETSLSSITSRKFPVVTQRTEHHIPEDGTLPNQLSDDLKS